MTAASDDQIVEALVGKWPSFPVEMSVTSDGGNRLLRLTAEQVAEAIEPIIKARESQALREAADAFAEGEWSEAFLVGTVDSDESAVRATATWLHERADRIEAKP